MNKMHFQSKKMSFVTILLIIILSLFVILFSKNIGVIIAFSLILISILVGNFFTKRIIEIDCCENNNISILITDDLGLNRKRYYYNISEISFLFKEVPYSLGIRKELKIYRGEKLIGKINEDETDNISLNKLVDYFNKKGVNEWVSK